MAATFDAMPVFGLANMNVIGVPVGVGGHLSRNVDKQVFGPYCLIYSHYNTGNRLSIFLLRRASRGYLVLYIYNEN